MTSIFLRATAPLALIALAATPASAQQVSMRFGAWTLVTSPDRCELTADPTATDFRRIVRKKVDDGKGGTTWMTTFVVLNNRYEPLAGLEKELPMAIDGKVFDTVAFYVSSGGGTSLAGAGLTPISSKDPTSLFKGKPVRITISDGGQEVLNEIFDVPAAALPTWRACSQ